jgi:hypothetical protein
LWGRLVKLASALARLQEIASLPAGYRDPKFADDPPHMSMPWVPLPAECLDTVRALMVRLEADGLPLPTEIDEIAPYMGNGGVGLSWRGAHLSLAQAPSVFLNVALVAGITCTVFETTVFERESHSPGYDAASLAGIYPFLSEGLAWWATVSRTV